MAASPVPTDSTRLSPHHVRTREPYRTPGPGAYESEGKAATLAAARQSSFGGPLAKAKRFDDRAPTDSTPGPGDYRAPSSVGKQVASTTANSPARSFGKSARDGASAQYYPGMMKAPSVGQVKRGTQSTPGPGAYSTDATGALIKPGVASAARPAAPASSFGGPLAAVSRVGTGALAEVYKNTVPGPGQYKTTMGMGKVPVSSMRSAATAQFPKAARFAKQQPLAPGLAPTTGTNLTSPNIKYAHQVSSVGKQTLSTRATTPSFSFGGRDTGAVHVTKSDTLIRVASGEGQVPGPGHYDIKTSPIRAKSALSTQRSHPAFSFGKGQREIKHRNKSPVPGPGKYAAAQAVGAQLLSSKRTGPAPSIGRARRDQVAQTVAPDTPVVSSSQSPGPGHYKALQSIGKQTTSRRRNAPGFKFGGSTRDHATKTYTTASMAEGSGDINTSSGLASMPGPGTYGTKSTLGQDPRFKHGPRFSFGGKGSRRRIGRDKASTRANIGPGSYNAPSTVGRRAASSRMRSATASRFGSVKREQREKVCAPSTPFASNTKTPGPGSYAAHSTFGKQSSSRFTSVKGGSWSRTSRDKSPKRSGSARPVGSRPGPGNYRTTSSVGRQGMSRHRNAPSFRFGTSSRSSVGVAVG